MDRLHSVACRVIGDPADAPWRKLLDYSADDYRELHQVKDDLDFVVDPADHLDVPTAMSFARRCELVGMHGGINGIGVGKDTAANALATHGFVSHAFADALKVSLSMTYGLPMRYMVDRSLKQERLPGTDLNPRRLMQLWGTEVVRSINDDVWLRRHLLRIASASLDLANIARKNPFQVTAKSGIKVTVPDVRFPNEGGYIQAAGGYNAWISRPSLDEIGATLSHGHSSEAGIPRHPTDLYLVNDGTVSDFDVKVVREVLARSAGAAVAAQRRSRKP